MNKHEKISFWLFKKTKAEKFTPVNEKSKEKVSRDERWYELARLYSERIKGY